MIQLLQDAKNEIVRLRRQNEILSAQMAVVDVFAACVGLQRNRGGMAPDVAWELEKKIEELKNEQTKEG